MNSDTEQQPSDHQTAGSKDTFEDSNRIADPSTDRRCSTVDPDMIGEVVLKCKDMANAIAHTINDVLACPKFQDRFVNKLDLDTTIIDEMLKALEWDPAYDEVLQTCVDKVATQRESTRFDTQVRTQSTVDEKAIKRALAIRRCLLQQKIKERGNSKTQKNKVGTNKTVIDEDEPRDSTPNSTFTEDQDESLQIPDISTNHISSKSSSHPSNDSGISKQVVLQTKSIQCPAIVPNPEVLKIEPLTPARKSPRKSSSLNSNQSQETLQEKPKPFPITSVLNPINIATRVICKPSATTVPQPSLDPPGIDYLVEWKRIRAINLDKWDNHLREELVRVGKNLSSGRRKKIRSRRKLVSADNATKSASVKKENCAESVKTIQKPCSSATNDKPELGIPKTRVIHKNVAILNMSSLLETPLKDNSEQQQHTQTLVKISSPQDEISTTKSANTARQILPSAFQPNMNDSSSSGSLSSYSGSVSGVEEMEADTKTTSNQQQLTTIKIEIDDDEDCRSIDQIVYDGSSCGDDDDGHDENVPISQLKLKAKVKKQKVTKLPSCDDDEIDENEPIWQAVSRKLKAKVNKRKVTKLPVKKSRKKP